jgi:hypothetical protein
MKEWLHCCREVIFVPPPDHVALAIEDDEATGIDPGPLKYRKAHRGVRATRALSTSAQKVKPSEFGYYQLRTATVPSSSAYQKRSGKQK